MNNFNSLGVVNRVSETQLQVSENYEYIRFSVIVIASSVGLPSGSSYTFIYSSVSACTEQVTHD